MVFIFTMSMACERAFIRLRKFPGTLIHVFFRLRLVVQAFLYRFSNHEK